MNSENVSGEGWRKVWKKYEELFKHFAVFYLKNNIRKLSATERHTHKKYISTPLILYKLSCEVANGRF